METHYIDILMFNEVKTALLHYANTHNGYSLINTGNRLFMVNKDSDGNVAEALDIYFK